MKIFIDNGHGIDTAGKRSPDGRFLEYKFNREIASRVAADLQDRGFDATLLVPELEDISLSERCQRVNAYCKAHGSKPCILISIHANAFGNGRDWTTPSGWSVYTSKGQTRADALADSLFEAAKKYLPSMKKRTDFSDGDADHEEDFYILRHTLCPCVLTENGFMTNEQECRWMMTEEAIKSIAMTHVDGIIQYLQQYKNT